MIRLSVEHRRLRRLRWIRAISALAFVLVCAAAYAVGYYLIPPPN